MRCNNICTIATILSLLSATTSSISNSTASLTSTPRDKFTPAISTDDTEPHSSGITAASSQKKKLCCIPEKWGHLVKSGIILTENNTSCSDSIGVILCHCVTPSSDYSSLSRGHTIGKCFYNCFHHGTRYPTEYHKLDCSDSGFTDGGVCARFKRKGLLCSKCIEGYGPPAYSFSLRCVPCANISLWITIPLYVFAAYGPLTIFLAVIVFFTLSINSAPLRGWILVCQIMSSYILMLFLDTLTDYIPDIRITQFIQVVSSVYGVWNLDFFRSVYTPFCLHPSLTTLQVMSLDYIIAAYPLVLILAMYVMVDMYSRNVRPVVVVGRVFHHCCVRFRHHLDIRTSLIDAFGTFFSLSFVKFLNTTINLLMSTRAIDSQGKATYLAYFDGNMEFFKGKHLAFSLTAIGFGLVCNILPIIIILLYSFPKTYRVLNILPVPVRTAMFPFMDNILASYKDGTNGTRNCRYFSVVYHLALFAFICSFAWTKSMLAIGLNTIACIVVGMLVAVIQPYKSKIQNTVDVILILGVGLCYAGTMLTLIAYSTDPKEHKVAIVFVAIPSFIPFFYFLGYSGLKSLRFIRATYDYITTCYRRRRSLRLILNSSGSEFDSKPLLQ